MLRRTVCSSSPLRVSEGVVAFCVLERRILVSYCQYHRSKANTVYGYGYFDYWGKGTLVTVTSGFLHGKSGSSYQRDNRFDYWGSGTMVTVTNALIKDEPQAEALKCLGTEFHRPQRIDLIDSQPVFSPCCDLREISKAYEYLHCLFSNTLSLDKEPISHPHVFIIPPSSEEIRANKTATIVCVARGFSPKTWSFKWSKDATAFDAKRFINTAVVEDSDGHFSAYSLLTATEDEWLESEIKCELIHGRETVIRTINSTSIIDCPGNVHVGISPPSVEEIFLRKEATLTCKATGLVSKDHLEIKWASETKEFETGTPEISSANGYFTAVSKLKVTFDEWARGDKFFCTVKQTDSLPSPRVAAYHRELDGPSHRPAVFLLSPSPQESTNGNGEVSLTCFVKDFYPEEVYITWLHSDNAVPQTFYTTTNLIPKKNGNPLFSVYSKLTVPTQEWTDGGIYTCVVYHETIQPPTRMITRNADSTGGCTAVSQDCSDYDLEEDDAGSLWTTASTFIFLFLISFFYSIGATFAKLQLTIFKCTVNGENECSVPTGVGPESGTPSECVTASPPNIHLLPLPCEGIDPPDPILTCIVADFNPKQIKVDWQINGSIHIPNNSSAFPRENDGKEKAFTLISHLAISMEEWKRGTTYSCVVLHDSKTTNETVSICTACSSIEPTIHLQKPSFEDIFNGKRVSADCFVVGLKDSTVSWITDGKQHKSESVDVKQNMNNTQSITRRLTVSAAEWKSYSKASCKVTHPCSTKEASITKETGYSKPALQILRPSEDQLEADSAELTCIITGFFPSDIYVKWQKGDEEIDATNYKNNPVAPESGGVSYSMVSRLTIPKTCSSIEPTIHLQKPSFEDIFKGKRVSADCFVVGLNDSTVSWITDGKEHKSVTVDVKQNKNNTQSITSRLTVSAAEWKSYSKASCKVTHPCSTKEASITKETGYSKPALQILRPSEDQLEADSAELTCIITGFFPSDIYVKWQKGDKDIGASYYKNNPAAPENGGVSYSMVSRLTIPKSEWMTRNTYSCMAAHGTARFEAKTPDNLFGYSKPALQILRPSEDQLEADSAELTCIISGFFPSDIYVKWQKGDEDIGASYYKNNPTAPENGGVSYSMVSRLTIPKSEWMTRNTYSCMAAHGTARFEAKTPDNLFACSSIEPTIHLQKPSFEDIFKGKHVSADCFVVGLNNSTVSWIIDGREHKSESVDVKQNMNNTQSITSRLTVSAAEWKSYSKASCKVTHPCSTKEASITKETGYSKPALQILRPSEDQLEADSAELTCIISGFFPSDIYVKWQKGDEEIDATNYKNNPVAPESGGVSYSMVSRLTIPKSEWMTQNTYSCMAAHGTEWFEVKTPDSLFGHHKNPILDLRQPSEDQLGADSAELTCIISGFFPSDIYVKWQKGDKDIDASYYKNNPVAPENGGVSYSMVSRLTIPKSEWMTRNTYSCKAAHGTEWFEAKTPDNLFASVIPTKPTIQLLQSSSELVCLVYGFSPKHIEIKWFLNEEPVSQNYTMAQPSKGADEIIEEKDFHDDNVDYFVAEDDMQGVWFTACTFIILFLISFLYSGFVTVVKAKYADEDDSNSASTTTVGTNTNKATDTHT
ncbi:UNVERIFIED_CONTAM: hypothetical protein FKN15_039134 [Acipenser sinensis]